MLKLEHQWFKKRQRGIIEISIGNQLNKMIIALISKSDKSSNQVN